MLTQQIADQLRVAVSKNLININILNQPMSQPTLVLLNQLLQRVPKLEQVLGIIEQFLRWFFCSCGLYYIVNSSNTGLGYTGISHMPDREFQSPRKTSQYVLYSPVFGYSDTVYRTQNLSPSQSGLKAIDCIWKNVSIPAIKSKNSSAYWG